MVPAWNCGEAWHRSAPALTRKDQAMNKAVLSHLAMIALLPLAGCTSGADFRHTPITKSNQKLIMKYLGNQLTIEEGQLLAAYLSRVQRDLQAGELPTGVSLHEMIAAQRAYERSQR